MNDIKLIITDLDGTILEHGLQANEEDIPTLKAVQEKGVNVTIATGQSWLTAKEIGRDLEVDKNLDLMVCNNGSIVSKVSKFDPIFIADIENKTVTALFNLANKAGLCLFAFYDAVGEGYWNGIECPSRSLVDHGWLETFEQVLVDDPNSFQFKKVVQLMLFVPEDILKNFEKELDEFREILEVTSSDIEDTPIFEFNKKNTSKATGVKFLIEHLNLNKKQVLVFGDNGNDVTMFQEVENSVAMQNAPDYVKQSAKHLTDTNLNAGVSKFIKKNLF